MRLRLRRARGADARICFDIYRDAVLNGTAPHYDAAQARAWIGDGAPDAAWARRVLRNTTWIAVDARGPAGFLTLAGTHLDLFFVRPRARGRGAAHRLYRAVERVRGSRRLTAYASLFLRPFLERRGWRVTETQRSRRGGQRLLRFAMERRSQSGAPSQVS